jgi:hypothetical protein
LPLLNPLDTGPLSVVYWGCESGTGARLRAVLGRSDEHRIHIEVIVCPNWAMVYSVPSQAFAG